MTLEEGDGESSVLVKDLYILVGNYETFSKNITAELKEIRKRLDKGNKTFDAINILCASRGAQVDAMEERVDKLEKKDALGGTTRTEKILIAIATVGNAFKWLVDIFK